MNKKQYKILWVLCQVFLFIFPIVVSVVFSKYEISMDQHLIDNVSGDYNIKLVWKLQHQEVYYLINLVYAIMISIALQLINGIWAALMPED